MDQGLESDRYGLLDLRCRLCTDFHFRIKSKCRKFFPAFQHFKLLFYDLLFSIEDMAACCGINRSYLGKIFHDSIGKTPQEFLIHYRMSKATELLKMTKLSIADIGNAVGYPNQLHFSRAFKKIYGVSPKNWRDQNHFSL